jgi:geranylgeranyl pyrophosphate synthase
LSTPLRASDGAHRGFEAWLAESRAWVEVLLERRFPPLPGDAARLREVLRYALLGGGKRLRPSLVRLVCEELGGRYVDCERSAVAVELIHAYSLVHDDLPCMDDDDLRRGRPTCHRVFGEALAVLAGDALQTAAFEVLASEPGARAGEEVRVLAVAVGELGMVGGQTLDMTLASSAALDAIRAMHARKTGALIAASAELGAIAADATPEVRAVALRYGTALGACFQAVDDLIDVTSDRATLGKTPGKDARARKATLVAALGVDGTRAEAEARAGDARRALRELGLAEDSRADALVTWMLARRA